MSDSAEQRDALDLADTPTTERLKQLPQMVVGLLSSDPLLQMQALVNFRKLLSIETNPPIQAVIEAHVVPRFVAFLQSPSPKLQFEAAWTLANISSGSPQQIHAVVDAGAVPTLVQLMRSPHDRVREQAIWALGNIAGDSVQLRDCVLSFNAMPLLLDNFANLSCESLVRNATWTLSNLCRGKPQPAFAAVKSAIPVLAYMLRGDDAEVLADVCWALSYLVDVPTQERRHPNLLDAGLVMRLAQLAGRNEEPVRMAARQFARCFVKWEATMICGALQDMQLPAPLLCEIMVHACAPLTANLPFHFFWNIAVAVKHFNVSLHE